jgi:MFS family permease
MAKQSGLIKWVIWSLAAFFYFYEILLRVSPSVMVPELMQSFAVDAAALGFLTSCFYYAYAPMQLPVGLLIDRFGAKNLLTFASIFCAFGAIIFSLSTFFLEAAFGRFLLGFGSSFAFVAMVYVCSHWFPASKRALLVGLANSIGMLGAFAGQGPLGLTLQYVNWRYVVLGLGLLGFLLALLVYLFVEKEKTSVAKKTPLMKSLLTGLKAVCKSKMTWMNAAVTLLFYMTTSAFGELWGVPFLQSAYGLSKHNAGFAISMIFLGWLIGGPAIGFFSDYYKTRKLLIMASIVLTLVCLVPILYFTSMPIVMLYLLLFFLGFFSSGELLNFTLATELHHAHVKGAAIAFTNCIVSFGSGLIQPIIGLFLDFSWTGRKIEGAPAYSPQDYQKAFMILPILLLLAFVLSLFIKEAKIKEEATQILSSD